jgi:hypothetical protein
MKSARVADRSYGKQEMDITLVLFHAAHPHARPAS